MEKRADFDQLVGLKINPENRWIKKAARISWIELEKKYTKKSLNKKAMLRNLYEGI